jgi:hypothetical protein
VANNPYGTGDIAGLSRRARLDRGILGVVAVRVGSAREAVGLVRGAHAPGLRVLTAKEIVVTAGAERIPVGIDGEAVSMATPVRCAIRPGALRVWVPRDRPGVPEPKPVVNWAALRGLAAFGKPRGVHAPLAAVPELEEESPDSVPRRQREIRLRTRRQPR